jgi:hypothetical protein
LTVCSGRAIRGSISVVADTRYDHGSLPMPKAHRQPNPTEDSIVRMVVRLTRRKPSKLTLVALASALNRGSSGSRHAKQRAQFVAIGIAKVSQIHRAGPTLARARWVLDRRPAIRDAGFVPGIGLFWAGHREADRAAVGVRRRLAIDGFTHQEGSFI